MVRADGNNSLLSGLYSTFTKDFAEKQKNSENFCVEFLKGSGDNVITSYTVLVFYVFRPNLCFNGILVIWQRLGTDERWFKPPKSIRAVTGANVPSF
jgi:hypothetical protein